MKKKSILNSPIEVKNENDIFATIQLARTTIQDAQGEREICPEICILCEDTWKKKQSKLKNQPPMLVLTIDQTEKLIKQMTTLKNAALAYCKNKTE